MTTGMPLVRGLPLRARRTSNPSPSRNPRMSDVDERREHGMPRPDPRAERLESLGRDGRESGHRHAAIVVGARAGVKA